jgi:exodeoxyribonuclease-3
MVGFGDAFFDAEGRYVEARFDTPKRKFSASSAATFPAAQRAKSGRRPSSASWPSVPAPAALKAEREFILWAT